MPRPIPTRARALRAAAFLAALAIALPALAQEQQQPQKKVSTKRTRKPAALTAPAQPVPAEPALTPLPPVAAEPLPVVSASAFRGSSSFDIGVGYWSGSEIGKGFVTQVDYGMDRTPASWGRLRMEWRLAIMFARPTEETPLMRVVSTYPFMAITSGFEKTTAYVVEVAPTARLSISVAQKVGLFLDAGAGIAQSMDTYERDEMFVGRRVKKENVTGLVVRAGLGLSYDATPRMRVLLLPLNGSIEIGPRYSAFQPMLAVAFGL